ncbi:MAG TPA: glycoside hydrolase family 31 protein [Verrucomicrobia bacterium]|nr:glycoside hydrolase family 31 protein [Verrucomicrobiota bacterium]HOP98172.1 glycoside hydrolase family 31 protein [Verrucomicrobiota bacterium]
MWVEPWGPDCIRVRATVLPEMPQRDWSLLPPAKSSANVVIDGELARLSNGRLSATVDRKGRVRFFRSEGGALLAEEIFARTNHPPSRTFKPVGGDLFHAEACFTAFEDERIYGLGQRRHGFLNQKGCVLELTHRNSQVSIPFMVSSRGYGLLWHNPGIGRVELGRTQTRWVAEATRLIDYVVIGGGDCATILERYADITGHAPLLPEWAAGFWQCKLRYRTQEELLNVAREHKRRGLPMSVIVVDYFHWTRMGDWKFDPACWPDPAGMVRELEEMGIKLMVSVWPAVNPDSENYAELDRRNLLVRAERGLNHFFKFRDAGAEHTVIFSLLDTTHPEARAFLWQKLRDNYYRHGIKVWWLDAIEPELSVYDHDTLRFHAGNGLEAACLYPMCQQQAIYEGMRGEGEVEVVTLGRAAFAGSQRYGAAVWSGDIHSTWGDLQQQVRAGLNMGLSGIPWWTTDIGGFFGGAVDSPEFQELIVRWFQYGVFCPLFRLHGWRNSSLEDPETSDPTRGGPNEVWSFGERAYGIIREQLFLRERLRPYIMEQMRAASERGAPPMRPLFFDFPGDPQAWAVEDQFLFGPDVLVAPVLFPGATEREVYLPAGAEWTDAWTGALVKGGKRVAAEAPLERIPIYVRNGRALPIGP